MTRGRRAALVDDVVIPGREPRILADLHEGLLHEL